MAGQVVELLRQRRSRHVQLLDLRQVGTPGGDDGQPALEQEQRADLGDSDTRCHTAGAVPRKVICPSQYHSTGMG